VSLIVMLATAACACSKPKPTGANFMACDGLEPQVAKISIMVGNLLDGVPGWESALDTLGASAGKQVLICAVDAFEAPVGMSPSKPSAVRPVVLRSQFRTLHAVQYLNRSKP
jgi:hypothetical protein